MGLLVQGLVNGVIDAAPISLPSSLFVAGDNVIAVEVHQNTLGSSDLSFLATLTASA